MDKVRFGICGMGRFGKKHLQHFSKAHEKYELVALCDIDAQRVNTLAKEHGCSGYGDYGNFLKNPDMELVIIVTRSLDHARNAEQALAAGKTVLLEKPIGVTADDYVLLQQLVKQYSGKLFFCHNHRFEPAFMNTQAIIRSGILGNVQVVRLCKHHEFMRRNDWQMRLDCGGGQLSVWGPHLLDQALQLLHSDVTEVKSYLKRILTPGDADDHVKIDLFGGNGRVIEIEISNSAAIPGAYCTVYGDRGTLVYGQDQKEIQLKYLSPEFQWPQISANDQTPLPGTAMSAESELPWQEEIRTVQPDTNMWEQVEFELVRHLYNTLRNNAPFPVTSEEALAVMRVTEIVKKQNPQFKWIG